MSNVTLSRDTQVHLTFFVKTWHKCTLILINYSIPYENWRMTGPMQYTSQMLCFAVNGGAACRELSQHLGQEKENWARSQRCGFENRVAFTREYVSIWCILPSSYFFTDTLECLLSYFLSLYARWRKSPLIGSLWYTDCQREIKRQTKSTRCPEVPPDQWLHCVKVGNIFIPTCESWYY